MYPVGTHTGYTAPTSKSLSGSTIHYLYPNWELFFSAVANADGSVSISGSMVNHSSNPLVASITLLKVNFPAGPFNLGTSTAVTAWPYNVNCADTPGFMAFEASATVGADVWMWEDQLGGDYSIGMSSGANWGGHTMGVSGDQGNPTPPGGSFQFSFKLRILGSEAAESAEVQALATVFSVNHPQVVEFYDHRPVGAMFFTGGGTKSDAASALPILNGPNPRNWLNDQSGATTSANVGPKLLSRIQSGVTNCVNHGYQGMIWWDWEGAGGPQGPNVYWGDMRLNRAADNPLGVALAPESDAIFDQGVQMVCGADLKIGFALRMNTVQNFSQYPANSFYPLIQDPFANSAAAVADLAARVLYLQARVEAAGVAIGKPGWGQKYCRLFYVDSAGQAPAGIGGSGLGNYGIWQALQQQFPDCMFAPEQNSLVDFAYAWVYRENRGGSNGPSPLELEVYPNAGVLLYLANFVSTSRAAVIAGMVAGNIVPLIDCWYVSPAMAWMDGMQTDLQNAGWTGYFLTNGQKMSLVSDTNALGTVITNTQSALSTFNTALAKALSDQAAAVTAFNTALTNLQNANAEVQALTTGTIVTDLATAQTDVAQIHTDIGA